MTDTVKIAAVQMDVRFNDIAENTRLIRDKLGQLQNENVFLTAFPECALCGYCFESLEDAMGASLTLDSEPLQKLGRLAEEFNTNIVAGFLELSGPSLFNAVALATRLGDMHIYRKVHLPYLGVDRFTTPGDRGFEVIDVEGLRIGLNICYDCSFPEPSRVLALRGADLVVLPTNWPPGAGSTADYIPNARALENNVYYMSVNRIGHEHGFEFIGKSKICHPDGHELAFANHNKEEILVAEIDPEIARKKRLVRVPGKHEIHRFDDRRPEMYTDILKDITKTK